MVPRTDISLSPEIELAYCAVVEHIVIVLRIGLDEDVEMNIRLSLSIL